VALFARHRFAVLLALAMVLAALPAMAQEEGEAAEEGDESPRPPEDAFVLPPMDGPWSPEFHPTYAVGFTRDRDISSWTHDFDMNYAFTKKVSFRASSNITLRENEVLNRQNRQETWDAGLSMALSSALSSGLKFMRSDQVDVRNEGKADEVRSFRNRESLNLTTDYGKTHLNGIGVTLGVSGGFERNEYADVESRGSTQAVRAGLKYEAPLGIRTDFSYAGKHSLLDSEQGALESTDESVEHSLAGRVEYEWMDNTFSVDMTRGTSSKEYPKEEQTERRTGDSRSLNMDASLNLLPDLTTKIGLGYSRNKTLYEVESSKDSDLTTRAVSASIGYKLGNTRLTTDLRADKKRKDYFDDQTGDSYSSSVGASLTHDFGAKLTAALRGRTSLLSHHYEDTAANDQDRDLFDQEAMLQLDYRPRNDVTTSLAVKVREDNLIYIRTTRTGDNKTSRTYSVKPAITKSFGSRVSVTQRYELSADYTFYTYDSASNFLIRNFAIDTSFDWSPVDRLKLAASHEYRVQDEGSYVEDALGVERYGKSSERQNHRMSLSVGYAFFGIIDVEARQVFSTQTKWKIDDGERDLSWEKFDTTLMGKASADHTLADGTTIRLSVGRTYRDATNILDRQRQVWDVSIDASKTF
jgi:hypothetical protein